MRLFMLALSLSVALGCAREARAGATIGSSAHHAKQRRYEARFRLKFSADVLPHFVVLSRAPARYRARLAQRLALFHATVYPRFFPRRTVAPLTIVVFDTPQQYWKKTKMNGTYGHYEPDQQTFFTYQRSGLGTFLHEVVHHYVHQNYGDHTPEWFNEGVASFFEMLGVTQRGYVLGYTNWRLPVLKQAIRRRSYTPIVRFLAMNDVPRVHGLSQARHLMVYLHHKGVLTRFVRSYDLIRQRKTTARELITRLTGLTVGQIDREFKQLALSWRKYQKI